MSETFPDPIFVNLHGTHDRTVWMRSWERENTPKGRGLIRCSLTDLSGSGVFDIATTYGVTKGLEEWQLTKRSQAELIAWARDQGREIEVKTRLERKPLKKRRTKRNIKQTDMGF